MTQMGDSPSLRTPYLRHQYRGSSRSINLTWLQRWRWWKQKEKRAKVVERGVWEGWVRPVTCVWISSLMERFVSCFFFTASRSTKGRMVMP